MKEDPEANSENDEIIDGGQINEISTREYRVDPLKKHKAMTERALAIALLVILTVSVLGHYTMTAWLELQGKTGAVEAGNSIFTTWLPVISGLASSAVTFFFTREK
jgi:hypothetical protein